MLHGSLLDSRAILAISEKDRYSFLQGLVSNDVNLVTPVKTIYATLLSPQGKYLFDFFILHQDNLLLLEMQSNRRNDLLQKLTLYKLRSHIFLTDSSQNFRTIVVLGRDAATYFGLSCTPGETVQIPDGVVFVDPRLVDLGVRLVVHEYALRRTLETYQIQIDPPHTYHLLRCQYGIPEGTQDLIINKSTLLECNLDTLNAISWTKGCYMGQELTARMKYRGLLKKRLLPAVIEGSAPTPGTPLLYGHEEVGTMCSHTEDYGLILLRLDILRKQPLDTLTLYADHTKIKPYFPYWLKNIPENPSSP